MPAKRHTTKHLSVNLTENDIFGERIARLDNGQTVKARIRRNFYPHQSYALVEVLTDAAGFVTLATAPIADFHVAVVGPTSPEAHDATEAALLELIELAETILL